MHHPPSQFFQLRWVLICLNFRQCAFKTMFLKCSSFFKDSRCDLRKIWLLFLACQDGRIMAPLLPISSHSIHFMYIILVFQSVVLMHYMCSQCSYSVPINKIHYQVIGCFGVIQDTCSRYHQWDGNESDLLATWLWLCLYI